MRKRIARTFKGHLEQQKALERNLQNKIISASKRFNEAFAAVKAFERKEKKNGLTKQEKSEHEKRQSEMVQRGANIWGLFKQVNNISSMLNVNANAAPGSRLERIRNEVRHRLVRDYSFRGNKVTRPIAHVAASIKISTGADDRVAIDRARTILSEAAAKEINDFETKKNSEDFDKHAFGRGMATIERKAKEVSNDILLNGESSKYMQVLKYRKIKKKRELIPEEKSYAEGFKWLEK